MGGIVDEVRGGANVFTEGSGRATKERTPEEQAAVSRWAEAKLKLI